MVGDVGRYIIRRVRLAHCKLGPERCEECREMDEERPCLLEIFPPGAGLMQRRVMELEVEGEAVWRAFEVVKVFADEAEARVYGEEKGIADVEL
jgi:hypothetical protein